MGEMSLAIAGGVESMSRSPWVMPKPSAAFSRDPEIFDTTLGWRFVNPLFEQKYGTISMAETAENVAEKYNVDRASQDRFALASQQKAAKAKAAGVFAEEIEPVTIPGKKGSATPAAVISDDEHPRADTTLEGLAKLPTPFRKGGTVTAGNASGINDGAVAMFVASEQAAAKFGLTPIARFVGASAAGVDPNYMGIGPIPAVQKLLARVDLKMDDIDFLELNEAFAAQALACTRAFGLPDDSEKVNPNGGAIALGHPLGMSGARLVLTSAMHLKRTGARRAIAAMCVGVGQGMAVLLEKV
jgi:acetyl-CoA acyltransferase